jgi:hypothetical protein
MHTLDGLAHKTLGELDALYRTASVPATMRAADGVLIGRMLAVRGVPKIVAGRLQRWAASPSFLWEGKTFQAASDGRGSGHNRVYGGALLGHQNLFPFNTSFGPSAIDGKPALILDYDLEVNPGYIRRIHDEIREVAPGLFFGPAMLKRGGGMTLALWFALDSRLS